MAGSQLPSGTVTFLFTDIEGSTQLIEELGEEGYVEALGEHRRRLRTAFSAHGGVEVDTQGDAFFYAFADPCEALAAAAGGQQALASGPVRVRMGLHTGKPHLTGEGYAGRELHRAARIAASGHGGQVVVSAATRALVDGDLTELGEHRLKDFPEPVALFQLGRQRFPPLKTISNTNLPRPASSFVGRQRERDELVQLLRDGTRLLTLSGPGGSGKTRLALEVASELVPTFKGGVFWVALAPLRDPALVTDTVAQTLGAKGGLADHVSERELLLLLDNFEQVVEAAPELSQLLEACPNLRLVVTSRQLLRIAGEVEYPVRPLAESEAVELFCQRSRLEADETIAELCRRLDHIPLALELAAARTRVLTPAQILDRLRRRLERLSGGLDLLKGGRDVDPRQQTLRATIEWSYDLLTDQERQLFARLAVFSGGCRLEAAEDVADADLDTLESLVDKSLLRRADERLWMLETIRDFASERLDARAEGEQVARRHAEWYVALVERLELPMRHGDPNATARLTGEIDNLRSSLEWLARQGDVGRGFRILDGLWYFWIAQGLVTEGLRWARWALDEAPKAPPDESVLGLLAASELFRFFGDPAEGLRLKLELLPRLRELSPERHFPATLSDAADMLAELGDFEQARRLGGEAVEWRREIGEPSGMNHALSNLAMVEFRAGNFAHARRLSEEALALVEEPYVPTNALYSALLAGESARRAGDAPSARRLLLRAVRICQEIGQRGVYAELLQEAAGASRPGADPVRILGASERLFRELGLPRWDVADYEHTVATLRGELGNEAFERAWSDGLALQDDQVLSLAAGCLA